VRKIISLFERNYGRNGDHLVRDEIAPGAEWVVAGEGVATRKWDGTCCMIRDGKLYKRYDAKRGKTPPANFEPAQEAPDPVTEHWPGWLPVGDEPESKWHRDALANCPGLPDGTYEAIGPRFQTNPERVEKHVLVPHGQHLLLDAPRAFEAIKAYLTDRDIEGIVWHHSDGRMVKIKAHDLGVQWPRGEM